MENLWKHSQTLKKQSPLVHNITNFVVMNNTANALLAVGASPLMAYAESEIDDIVSISDSLVINVGTLDEYWAESMFLAAKKAHSLKKPWVLDPVGAGASAYRDQVIQKLIRYSPAVIRGNASEIMALANANKTKTKGVDSTLSSTAAEDVAKRLAQQFQNIVCVSGATDIITDGEKTTYIKNGTPMMTNITGMGCTATALIGAFCGVIDDKMAATVTAMALLGISAEIAVEGAHGPGSLQVKLLDKLYNLTKNEFVTHAKITAI